MMNNTGKQSTRSQQLLLQTLIPRVLGRETILIHHVTETNYKLQIEFERSTEDKVSFERIIL